MSPQLGLLYAYRNPAWNRRPWPTVYREELELTCYAEELGYDNVWMSEHHFVDDGYMSCPLTIAAAVAARTTKIRIGTYVVLMPMHDPVRIAEQAATVDLISDGRLDLGLGLGYRPEEFTGAGLARRERGARMAEGSVLIQRLLNERKVSHAGKYYQVNDVGITPPPAQQPCPIWVGARADAAIERAAKHGFHLAGIGPREHTDKYREALVKYGRDPKDYHVGQIVTCFVAPTTAQAWDRCAEGLHHMLSRYLDWAIESGDVTAEPHWSHDSPVPSPAEMRRTQSADFFGEPSIVGSPEEVFQRLCEHREQNPYTHLAIYMNYPGTAQGYTRESMELFASEIAPRLRAL